MKSIRCELPFETGEEKLGVLIPLHGDVLEVFLKVVPLGITSWWVPAIFHAPSTEPVACILFSTGCPCMAAMNQSQAFRTSPPFPAHIDKFLDHTPPFPTNLLRTEWVRSWSQSHRSNPEQPRKLGIYSTIINFCPSINFGTHMLFCDMNMDCLLYTSPSPRDLSTSRMPSSA